jgi:hypothetical protein
MNKWELFQKFLVTQEEQIQLPDFIVNAVLIILLAWLLGLTYRKCGKTLSNRRSFAHNFILLGFATMLVISIVKSSLALSLGLVGALSIVRFRAAIKEPEELSYLFLVISLGLGLGANLRLITIVAFIIIVALIWLRYFLGEKNYMNDMFLTITSSSQNLNINDIQNAIKTNFANFQLKRFDKSDAGTEISFLIEKSKKTDLDKFTSEIKKLYNEASITFIDNKIS